MNILLIGSQGQLGQRLRQALPMVGHLTALDRNELDLCHAENVRAAVRHFQPDIIINAAAYTAVDRAEAELELAYAVNTTAPGLLAQEAARLGSLLIHYSTDYVFDGLKRRPYSESDECAPLNVYGRTKRAGELEIIESRCAYLIFRTSWVYDLHGRNFLNTMRRLREEKPEISVINDQIGAPTWANTIAEVTKTILSRQNFNSQFPEVELLQSRDIFHLTAAGQTSWYGFAEAIFQELGLTACLRPIPTAEYQTNVQRPAYSILDNTQLNMRFGITQSNWRDELRTCLAPISTTLLADTLEKSI